MTPLSPLASWCLVAIVVGLPTLMLYCAIVVGRRAEENARRPLHRHVCSRCGRVQLWTEKFEQWSPCPACQILQPGMVASTPPREEKPERRPYDEQVKGLHIPGKRTVEIDFDTMTPEEIAQALDCDHVAAVMVH